MILFKEIHNDQICDIFPRTLLLKFKLAKTYFGYSKVAK